MIRLASVVGRHLFRCGLHGSKVIAHPRKTGKRCGWWVMGGLNFGVYNFCQRTTHLRLTTAIEGRLLNCLHLATLLFAAGSSTLRGT